MLNDDACFEGSCDYKEGFNISKDSTTIALFSIENRHPPLKVSTVLLLVENN